MSRKHSWKSSDVDKNFVSYKLYLFRVLDLKITWIVIINATHFYISNFWRDSVPRGKLKMGKNTENWFFFYQDLGRIKNKWKYDGSLKNYLGFHLQIRKREKGIMDIFYEKSYPTFFRYLFLGVSLISSVLPIISLVTNGFNDFLKIIKKTQSCNYSSSIEKNYKS